jgi:hypothetical protein
MRKLHFSIKYRRLYSGSDNVDIIHSTLYNRIRFSKSVISPGCTMHKHPRAINIFNRRHTSFLYKLPDNNRRMNNLYRLYWRLHSTEYTNTTGEKIT